MFFIPIERGEGLRSVLSRTNASNLPSRRKPHHVVVRAHDGIDHAWQGTTSNREKLPLIAVSRQPKQTVFCRDEKSSSAVDGKRLIRVVQCSHRRRKHDRLKPLLYTPRNPFARPHPKISVRRRQDELHQFAGQSLRPSKAGDTIAVIAEQASLGPDPKKSLLVLRHSQNGG